MADQESNRRRPAAGRRLDRRVVLKATAAFGAMSLLGGAVQSRARAQNPGETIAGTWVEAESGGFTAAAAGEAQAFQTDFGFYAVAPHWGAEAGPGASVELSLSADGTSWSEPIQVYEAVEDAGGPESGARRFGRLVATEGASFIRYRPLDANGTPTSLPSLAFTYIDASGGPSIDDVYAAALTPSLAPPPIISRAAWGANESYRYDAQGNEIWPPEYQTVEHVIIHHTDTANFQDPLIAMRSIYHYHAVTRGWGDIGYNYLVDFLGNVYEGRVGGENVVGGHSYQYAYGSSGIGTIGRFSFEPETPEAQAGLVWISAWVGRDLDPFGQKPFQDIPSLPTICAHRDVNNTTCPGDVLYGDLPTIREYVNAVLSGGVDPAPDPDFLPGDIVETIVADGNLREGPGLAFGVRVRMQLGEVLTITDGPTTNDGYTWYAVQGGTLSGWAATIIFRKRTTNPPPPPPSGQFGVGNVVSVNTDSLNLRSAPGTSAGVIATMPFGTRGTVAGGPQSANGYAWYQLSTAYGTGWSAGSFLILADSPPPPPPPPPPSGGFAVGDTASVNTDSLNLRSGPGLGQGVIARMPFGTQLSITQAGVAADGYTWYGVSSTQYGSGWCAGELLAPAGSGNTGIQVGDTVQVIDGSLNVRAAPSTSAAIQNVMPDGTRLSVVGGPAQADGYTWYQVSSASYGTGWSAASFLQEV